eukprot:TRINITY_DN546_c5_g1_i1.p1 TRINITY_DN546_c5_g1~~TRINITY_DN546_c5_g1_i1.p1  ORF type:complete len:454 (+),score=117.55 TRINITY_DN546_c5_g1_i1:70-1362(+)
MKFHLAAFLAVLGGVAGIDNGYGLTPPMGWRSWNCYGRNVNQTLMETVMDKMAAKGPEGKSLLDVGYVSVGLDDNWQACGAGVNGSFHDEQGNPIINLKTFPDMKAMTSHGHSLGLKVGWYMNNCICRETTFTNDTYIALHMEASAAAVANFEFDGVKLDGCGQFMNLTWWGALLNATGRPIMIENCHWGRTYPGQHPPTDAVCTGTTAPSDCPYNFYRSSGDIRPEWLRVMNNLQTVIEFEGRTPRSIPGAWAYPDMLEVGNLASHGEDRTHFAAWCIVSSPLVLGYDVTNDTVTQRVWDIIANEEAIAVNQAWVGSPGQLVKNIMPPDFEGDVGIPQHGVLLQIWAKPVTADGNTAVLVINNSTGPSYTVQLNMTDFGFLSTDKVTVRDIYSHADVGAYTGHFTTDMIPTHDSRFYMFSKSSSHSQWL